MDNHERSTLEQILNLLHGLIGRDDAKADFRPDLSFVSDCPDSSGTETLIFPSRIFAEPENEKSPPASAEGTEKEKPDEDRREGRFLKFTDKELQKMASYFKKDYLIHAGEVAHIRQKENGTFEIRYRRNGRDISRSGKTIEIAKARFMAAAEDGVRLSRGICATRGTTSARGGRRETIRTKCCARRAKTNTSRWTSASA